MPPVSVYCNDTTIPRTIDITFQGVNTFSVSEGAYDLISGPLGLPPNPCNQIPGSTGSGN